MVVVDEVDVEDLFKVWIGVCCVVVLVDVWDYLEFDDMVGILVDEVIEDLFVLIVGIESWDVIIVVGGVSIGLIEDFVEVVKD